MLPDVPNAAALDALEARHLALYAAPFGETRPFGSGLAVYGGPDLPVNRAVGLGQEAHDARFLPELEAFFAQRGLAAQVEVSSHVAPAFLAALGERGYHLTRVLNTYARALHGPLPAPRLPVRQADEAEWLGVVTEGFGAGSSRIMTVTARRPQTSLWVCGAEGGIVAGGALSLLGDFAQLFSATTRPAFRERGAQSALLAARLKHAREQGARWAVVSAGPGSASARNVLRAGFVLAAARLNFVRTGS